MERIKLGLHLDKVVDFNNKKENYYLPYCNELLQLLKLEIMPCQSLLFVVGLNYC